MKKKSYDFELLLPFEFIQTTEENEAGVINIRFSGEVLGEYKVGNALYNLKDRKMYSNGDYEQIVEMLKNNENKKIKVLFQVKNGKALDFKIDLESLILIYNDNRLANLELMGWGLNEIFPPGKILNNKIILGPDKTTRVVLNVCIWIMGILLFLLNLLCLINVYLFLFVCPISIIFMVFFYSYLRSTIEIENSIITKTKLFNRKKVIGNMSQITSYTINRTNITVFSNNKKFFSFGFQGVDNFSFREYLKNNYEFSICIFGNKFISYLCYIFGILFVFTGNLFYILLGVLLILKGLDEYLKEFQIIGDMITYKKLFINKKINLSNLSQIEYYKRSGYGRYSYAPTAYEITGYDNNGTKVFRVKDLTTEKFEHLKEVAKKYNIKVRKI